MAATRARRRTIPQLLTPSVVPEAPPTAVANVEPAPAKPVRAPKLPFLLDFFPLETPDQTRLSAFYDALRRGKFRTTRCPNDHQLHWPPRVACPKCHTETLEWVELPTKGRIYAFSAVLAGAPLGMEADVPFVVGLVDLDGAPLRLFGRIVGRSWDACKIGDPVRFEPFEHDDGRFFYRFRVEP
ncbi:MAG: Zn-ribbon domain-containing OB-fold protein [Thermoplasmata archaeon]|nr:Zn-ribbon domain-containing OB-fold protein [Thermoplasmata archaeon]